MGEQDDNWLDWLMRLLLSSVLGPASTLLGVMVVSILLTPIWEDREGTLFLAFGWWTPAEMVLSFLGLLFVGLPAALVWKEALLERRGKWIARLLGLVIGAVMTNVFAVIVNLPPKVTFGDPEALAFGAPFGVAAAHWWLVSLRKWPGSLERGA